METRLICLLCNHEKCSECVEDQSTAGTWVACCRCDFGGVVSLWIPEHADQVAVIVSGDGICQHCGHVRCDNCLPDRWPKLSDGCCSCLARALNKRRWRVH